MLDRLPSWVVGGAYRVAHPLLRLTWFFTRPRSAGVRCVLRHGGEILLVRHTYGDRGWMLPGGRVQSGETPLATAQREMHEELAVRARTWTLLGTVTPRASYRRDEGDEPFRRHTTHYIAADLIDRRVTPRAAELAETGWFAPTALPAPFSAHLFEAIDRGFLR